MFRFVRRTPRRQPRGITLVELMVVVAVISVLSIALLSAYRGTRAQAVDGRLVDTLDQVRRITALYQAAQGAFPTNATNMKDGQANIGSATYTDLATALRSVEDALPTVPTDATINIDGATFTYYPNNSASPGPTYTMVAKATGGTGSKFCVDVGRVVNIGSGTPVTPGSACQ